MAWSTSKIFRQYVADVQTVTSLTGFTGLDSDTIRVALYNNSITPDQNVTAANTAYNAGVWANTNEITSSSNWPAAGVALTGQVVDASNNGIVFFDANDTASGGSATLSNVQGCLVYDDSVTNVADRGVCYNSFGGAQSVTNGTLTLVWNVNGIMRFTL